MFDPRRLLRILAFVPPIIILAAVLGATSCGRSPYQINSSGSPTSTSTPGSGAAAFVTNVGSGFITEYKRNTTTGILTYNTRITAGTATANGGPTGIAITQNNNFLYAANSANGNIYQYTVGTDGTLTPMTPPSVSNGVNSAPISVVTISSAGTPTWLLVANNGEGTISAYPIQTAGPLGTAVSSSAPGMSGPFGLAVNSAGTVVYVSDNAAGVIYAFTFDSTTGKLTNLTNPPLASLGGQVKGAPGFLALGPLFSGGNTTGNYLLVGDTNPATAIITMFFVNAAGTGVPSFVTQAIPAANAAIGVAWAGSTVALSANQNTSAAANGSISSYILSNGGALTASTNVLAVNGATSVVVDPQQQFAYSTDKGDGTINQYQLNVACQSGGTVQTICLVNTIKADPKIANPAPFAMTLTN